MTDLSAKAWKDIIDAHYDGNSGESKKINPANALHKIDVAEPEPRLYSSIMLIYNPPQNSAGAIRAIQNAVRDFRDAKR